MKKANIATCGCWFIPTVCLGPIVILFAYRIAHWKYNYSQLAGHHFGGADFALFEALVKAVLLGPLLGLATVILVMTVIEKKRYIWLRVAIALILAIIPFVFFTMDLCEYKERDARMKETSHF